MPTSHESALRLRLINHYFALVEEWFLLYGLPGRTNERLRLEAEIRATLRALESLAPPE